MKILFMSKTKTIQNCSKLRMDITRRALLCSCSVSVNYCSCQRFNFHAVVACNGDTRPFSKHYILYLSTVFSSASSLCSGTRRASGRGSRDRCRFPSSRGKNHRDLKCAHAPSTALQRDTLKGSVQRKPGIWLWVDLVFRPRVPRVKRHKVES